MKNTLFIDMNADSVTLSSAENPRTHPAKRVPSDAPPTRGLVSHFPLQFSNSTLE